VRKYFVAGFRERLVRKYFVARLEHLRRTLGQRPKLRLAGVRGADYLF
jgi:hypothetical protein